jgi:hypothetical protein
MNGEKRYDYAMIDFLSDAGLSATWPAMILGFLQYNITLGSPTPHFSDEEGQSLHTIQDNMAVSTSKLFKSRRCRQCCRRRRRRHQRVP